MTRVAALLLALAAWACGGGGGGTPVSGIVTPTGTLRTDLLFGYFAGNASVPLEVAGHANLHHAADFYGPLEQMAGLIQARAAGMRVILSIPTHQWRGDAARMEHETRFWFQRLRDAGLLWDGIVAVQWIDEPETERVGNRSDAEVTAGSALVRRVMAEFPEISGARLAVFYACATGRTPGIASFDWIGCDHYDAGCGVLRDHVPRLGEQLRGDQRLLLIAGGADPWRQDPACFESFAHRDSRVVALIAFIWQTVTDDGTTYRGIRENGLRPLYCQAGRKIVAGTSEGCA